MDAAQALSEHLESFVDANMPTDGQHARAAEFVIETLEQATWAARKIREARQRADEIGEAAEAEVDRIVAWRDEAMRPHLDSIDHLSAMLRYYHQTEHDAAGGDTVKRNPKTSIKLPHDVTLTSRAQPDVWDVDADVFVPWARVSAPDYVQRTITYAPKVADLKAATKAADVDVDKGDGGVLIAGIAAPGVTVTERPRKFDVTIG